LATLDLPAPEPAVLLAGPLAPAPAGRARGSLALGTSAA